MKKIYLMALSLMFVAGSLTTSFADDNVNYSGSGDTLAITVLTVTDATGAGPDMTFPTSPSVGISCTTSKSKFTITSAHTIPDTTNGLEYGVDSDEAGYYQKTKTTGTEEGPTATDDAETLVGSGWTYIGAGSS